ncbi:AbrB/MazE/SpoVT family DNA-binding domain-containing protein [Candidatus Woesearchaeota archaeon]|nr:AbrB/MazE/SpoVT family DNA-binding domain-containing protein [Candidatus Woesearchaeota archaeon]
MVKIQKLPSGQLVITIPKLLAEYEGLKKGMEMEFRKHKDGFILEIKKKSTKIKDFRDTKNSKNFLVKGG